jgi:hypothetical protein
MASVPPPDDSSEDFPLPERESAETAALEGAEPVGPENSAALLAELDALLERMMALPVNQAADDPTERRDDEPPEHLPIITVAEAMPDSPPFPAPAPHDDLYYGTTFEEHRFGPSEPEPTPPASRPPEPVTIWHRPRSESVPEVPPPFVPPPLSRSEPEPRANAQPSVPPPPEEVPPAPAWMAPLVGLDLAFRAVTAPFGVPGRWLRRPAGRSLLAVAGFAMLVAAGGVVLGDYLGWTW